MKQPQKTKKYFSIIEWVIQLQRSLCMRSSEILYYDDYNPVHQYFSKLYSKIDQNSILLSLPLSLSLLTSFSELFF